MHGNPCRWVFRQSLCVRGGTSVSSGLLNAIYVEDFLGFSYGFRPGRGPHDALDALMVGITTCKVNHILDADIRSFFDMVSQDWLFQFGEHRVGDPRIIRLIRKWLQAGVLEDGAVTVSDRGTGQGSVASPLLANIYLHYVFDLWAERWRRREATGDMIIVRYADDLVIGFQHEGDAHRFLDAMRERLEKFALSLHPDKTRLIEFGRHAAARRAQRGLGKPETFDFLGFTLICSRSRGGSFMLKRKTRRDRVRAKLAEVKVELRRRMHQTIPEQGDWLAQVLRGVFAYYAVPTNFAALADFRAQVVWLWRRALRRRSQKDGTLWDRMTRLANETTFRNRGYFIPGQTSGSPPNTRGRSRMPKLGTLDLCGGREATRLPTAIVAWHLLSALLLCPSSQDMSDCVGDDFWLAELHHVSRPLGDDVLAACRQLSQALLSILPFRVGLSTRIWISRTAADDHQWCVPERTETLGHLPSTRHLEV
jgi:group II intron reverse transcriptase/maturase